MKREKVLAEDVYIKSIMLDNRVTYEKTAKQRQSDAGKNCGQGITSEKQENQKEKGKAVNLMAKEFDLPLHRLKYVFSIQNNRPELLSFIGGTLTIEEAKGLVVYYSKQKDKPIVEGKELSTEAEKILGTIQANKNKPKKCNGKNKKIFIDLINPSKALLNKVNKYAREEFDQGMDITVEEACVTQQHYGKEKVYSPQKGLVYGAWINGKIVYVGKTESTLEKRIQTHFNGSSYTPFDIAIKKYDASAVTWEPLCYTKDIKVLKDLEHIFIKHYDTRKNGYNQMV